MKQLKAYKYHGPPPVGKGANGLLSALKPILAAIFHIGQQRFIPYSGLAFRAVSPEKDALCLAVRSE